jgi:hypothetical protein
MKPVPGPRTAVPREPSIAVAGHQVASKVAGNIHAASQKTGTKFSYLMAQAAKESGFASEAKSRHSSASGLFQFTRQTWLQMVKQHGSKHGLDQFAQAITRSSNGEYTIADPAMRKTVLDLRRDPQVSSMMAAEYAKDNETYLEKRLGREVGDADLYLAHFLGPAGAAKLLKAREQDSTIAAADILPKAAKANPTVFYAENNPRSVAAVYDKMRHAIERPSGQYAKIEGAVEARARTEMIAAAPTIIFPPAEMGIVEARLLAPQLPSSPREEGGILVAETETIPAGSGSAADAAMISQAMPPRQQLASRTGGETAETMRAGSAADVAMISQAMPPRQELASRTGGETAERIRNWARGFFN